MDLLGFQILHKTMGRVKKCFVFGCRNDSKNSPHKYFFWVPCDKKQRKIWYEQARTEDKVQEKTRRHKFSKSNQHCCEDHFDFSTDADNSMQVKLLGRGTIHPELKPGSSLTSLLAKIGEIRVGQGLPGKPEQSESRETENQDPNKNQGKRMSLEK